MPDSTMRYLRAGLVACALFAPSSAYAEPEPAGDPSLPPESNALESDVDALERIHRETIHTRRLLADTVLVAGLVSVAGGGALIVPSADDQAWRYAGLNTALFGAINTVVGLLALHGIASEERSWESPEASNARRSPGGLARAKIHAVVDERRESVGHAINLGLNCAYLGVAGTAVLASQFGAEHPRRWLASGAAIGFQALFLVGIDFIGLTRSQAYHRAFVERLMPTFAMTPLSTGTETRFGLGGTF